MAKSGKISINQLDERIQAELNDYAYIAQSVVDKAIDMAADAGAEELQKTSPKRTGAYASSWTAGGEKTTKTKKSKVIYADAPHYRLTHLLEKGHAKVNGGRTKPIQHIEPAEAFTIDKFIKFIKEGLK